MDFKQKINVLSALVETWAQSSALVAPLACRSLRDAASYSLFSGGKRIRPVLSLLVAEMLDVDKEALRDFVLALELIHTSSLIHDDLPGLDNDDFRRGKPTCHRVYGEGTAIIAGDLLIAQAFQLVAAAKGATPSTRAAWAAIIAEATISLCDGQVLDLEHEKEGEGALREIPAEERIKAVLLCHRKKTGALFRAAASGPVELAGWGKTQGLQQDMEFLGEEIGALFQLTDDLLDATPDADGREDRGFSVVRALGLPAAEALVRGKLAALERLLEPFGSKGAILLELVRGLSTRSH